MSGRNFSNSEMIISSRSPRASYGSMKQKEGSSQVAHWGQRKLLLAEIQFLTFYWDPQVVARPLCIHCGDPGQGLEALCRLFPSVVFEIYFKGKITMEGCSNVKLFPRAFTDNDAQKYAGRDDVFFISDYRSRNYDDAEQEVFQREGIRFAPDGSTTAPPARVEAARKQATALMEKSIMADLEQQQSWFLMINPVHGLLKFRLPYTVRGVDQVYPYLNGLVFWQAWAPPHSTETRLKPTRNSKGEYEIISYSTLVYEQQCYYHNLVTRLDENYLNPFTSRFEPIDHPQLLTDYDSSLETQILISYAKRVHGALSLEELYRAVVKYSHILTWKLNIGRKPNNWKTLQSKREPTPPVAAPVPTPAPTIVGGVAPIDASQFILAQGGELSNEPFILPSLTELAAQEPAIPRPLSIPFQPLPAPTAPLTAAPPAIPDFSQAEEDIIPYPEIAPAAQQPPAPPQFEPIPVPAPLPVVKPEPPVPLKLIPVATQKLEGQMGKDTQIKPRIVVVGKTAAPVTKPGASFPSFPSFPTTSVTASAPTKTASPSFPMPSFPSAAATKPASPSFPMPSFPSAAPPAAAPKPGSPSFPMPTLPSFPSSQPPKPASPSFPMPTFTMPSFPSAAPPAAAPKPASPSFTIPSLPSFPSAAAPKPASPSFPVPSFPVTNLGPPVGFSTTSVSSAATKPASPSFPMPSFPSAVAPKPAGQNVVMSSFPSQPAQSFPTQFPSGAVPKAMSSIPPSVTASVPQSQVPKMKVVVSGTTAKVTPSAVPAPTPAPGKTSTVLSGAVFNAPFSGKNVLTDF